MAAELVSYTTASALKRYNIDSKLGNIIQLVNGWFNLFNTRTLEKKNVCGSTYSISDYLDEQNQLLEKIGKFMKEMRCVGKLQTTFQVFQKCIVQTTVALPLLFESVKVHSVKYIMTSHLNQDITENLFSRIRGSGYDHSSPLVTSQRLRSVILGANPSSVFNNTNTEDYNDSEFLVCNVLKCAKIPLPKTIDSENPEYRQCSIKDSNSFFVVPIQDNSVEGDTDSDPDDLDPNPDGQHNCVEQKRSCSVSNRQEDAFQYLVGYIAKKLHTNFWNWEIIRTRRVMIIIMFNQCQCHLLTGSLFCLMEVLWYQERNLLKNARFLRIYFAVKCKVYLEVKI